MMGKFIFVRNWYGENEYGENIIPFECESKELAYKYVLNQAKEYFRKLYFRNTMAPKGACIKVFGLGLDPYDLVISDWYPSYDITAMGNAFNKKDNNQKGLLLDRLSLKPNIIEIYSLDEWFESNKERLE